MTGTRRADGRDVAPTTAEPRTSSHTRFKSPVRRASGTYHPPTLPPPPFSSEAQVAGLEWWLDAHMGLAAELLCVEQVLEGASSRPNGHVDTVKRLVAHVEAVRDALYELYCDAADDRVASLVAKGAPLEQSVRASYSWCAAVVALLAELTGGLRSAGGPDWTAVKASYRATESRYPAAAASLREAVASLSLDYASPVEPLRHLPQHVDELFGAAATLRETLAKRFG
jgi:hypothetical protein